MRVPSSLRGILRCAVLPRATGSDLEQLLARAGIHNRGPCRYISTDAVPEAACSEGLPLPKSEADGSSKNDEPSYWILPWWWKSKAVWKHHDLQNIGRISVFEHMRRHAPIVSQYLYGETWLTDVTTESGITFISGLSELYEEMKAKGVSFFDPFTADMLVMDEFGKPHIANGVLLQLFTHFSHSLGIIYGADVIEDLFSQWRQGVMTPDVLDFVELMRTPWLQPEYLMLVHYACLHKHQRAPAFMKVFDSIFHALDPKAQHMLFLCIQRRAFGWGDAAMENMLLRQYLLYDQKISYDLNSARDGLLICRHGECHVLGFLHRMANVYGFPFRREDQQLLLHVKLGLFCSMVQRSLWHELGEDGREYLKQLKEEEFFCSIGICCCIGECMRIRVFEHEAKHHYEQSEEKIKAILRVANISRCGISDETCILQTPEWYNHWYHRSYFKPNVMRWFDQVVFDYYARNPSQLTVHAGDTVELIYEPHHCNSEKNLCERYCYVRDWSGNLGFVRVSCLWKYDYLFR